MITSEKPLVLKWGSTSTTNSEGVDKAKIDGYAGQIEDIKSQFRNIIVVASGSVAVGQHLWRQMHGERPYPGKQTLAMLGTAQAHMAWQEALAKHGLLTGQLLASHHEVDDRSANSILEATIRDNFRHGVIPEANENDAIRLEEMAKFSYGGENDGLAAHLAIRFDAHALIINSDVEGLMRLDDRSSLIKYVDLGDANAQHARVQAGWVEGTEIENGALTKVNACLDVREAGVQAFITQAGTPFIDVLEYRAGTYFQIVH